MANRGSFEKRASRGPRMQDCGMRQSCPKGTRAIVGRATPKLKYQLNPARKLSVPLDKRARRLTECPKPLGNYDQSSKIWRMVQPSPLRSGRLSVRTGQARERLTMTRFDRTRLWSPLPLDQAPVLPGIQRPT